MLFIAIFVFLYSSGARQHRRHLARVQPTGVDLQILPFAQGRYRPELGGRGRVHHAQVTASDPVRRKGPAGAARGEEPAFDPRGPARGRREHDRQVAAIDPPAAGRARRSPGLARPLRRGLGRRRRSGQGPGRIEVAAPPGRAAPRFGRPTDRGFDRAPSSTSS